METLEGRVTVVTGASRGIGKGIAIALGAAGATVYVTGRSARGTPTLHLGGTIEETAGAVTAAGGRGIAVECDHRDDEATERLFATVGARIDVLVNNVWGGYEGLHRGEFAEWGQPFWEQEVALWDPMFAAGVRAHYACSVHAARRMVPRRSGLIVTVSHVSAEGLIAGDNVAYGGAKALDNHLMRTMAIQLRPHGVAAVALYPGLVRTEGILQWAEYLDLSTSESPAYTGRAVVALACDPMVIDESGQVLAVGDLARAYGFTDLDGTQPEPLRPTFLA